MGKQTRLNLRLIFAVAVVAISAVGAEAADKIRIAVSNPNMPNLTVQMALSRGFFREENLDAEIIRMNPNVAITALASDFTPLTDLRASAAYRQRAAGNLLRRFWLETRTAAPLSAAQTTVWAREGVSP